MKPTSPSPEELLSAYADGALSDSERATVEAYLADHPDARSELDEIRSLLSRVRENPPEPAREPDWAAMNVAINEAIDTAGDGAKSPGLAARLRAWLAGLAHPRVALGALAIGAAAAVIVALATGWPGGQDRGSGLAKDDIRAPERGSEDGAQNPGDEFEQAMEQALREAVAEVEDESGDAERDDDEVIDALFEALDPDAISDETEAELLALTDAMERGDGLPDDLIDELLGSEPDVFDGTEGTGGTEGAESVDGADQDGRAPSRYDGWLDELSDQELDSLDAMLGEMMAV